MEGIGTNLELTSRVDLLDLNLNRFVNITFHCHGFSGSVFSQQPVLYVHDQSILCHST